MSLFKYFGERGGDGHGGELQWARTPGHYPFRNFNQPALTEAQLEIIEETVDFHCRVFELWEPEQLQEYQDIRDRCANGWYRVLYIDRQMDSERKHWRIYLEWVQVYEEVPNGKRPPPRNAPPVVGLTGQTS